VQELLCAGLLGSACQTFGNCLDCETGHNFVTNKAEPVTGNWVVLEEEGQKNGLPVYRSCHNPEKVAWKVGMGDGEVAGRQEGVGKMGPGIVRDLVAHYKGRRKALWKRLQWGWRYRSVDGTTVEEELGTAPEVEAEKNMTYLSEEQGDMGLCLWIVVGGSPYIRVVLVVERCLQG
jgi:hypothetical protein